MPFVCFRISFECTRTSLVFDLCLLVCHPYIPPIYLHVIRMPFVCKFFIQFNDLYGTRISFVRHSYVLVRHSYVTPVYLYVIHITLVCTRMSFECIHTSLVCRIHSYLLACHPYVTRIYLYVIRMSYLYVTCMSLYATCLLFVCTGM